MLRYVEGCSFSCVHDVENHQFSAGNTCLKLLLSAKSFLEKVGIWGDWWKTGTELASLQFWRTRKVEPDGGPLDDEGKPQRSLTWIILQDRVCSSSSWNSIVEKMPKIFKKKTKVQIVQFFLQSYHERYCSRWKRRIQRKVLYLLVLRSFFEVNPSQNDFQLLELSAICQSENAFRCLLKCKIFTEV